MKFSLFSICAALIVGLCPLSAQEFDHSHAAFTKILNENVRETLVDYGAIKDNPSPLKSYLESISAVTPEQFGNWTAEQQLAFLINAYNAGTIQLIVDNYPITSIQRIPNTWAFNHIPLFGGIVSSDTLEHGIIRQDPEQAPDFELQTKFAKDPRIHFALVCAAVGCPPLRNEAFVAERLGEQMDEQGKVFFSQTHKIFFDDEKGTLFLSPILDWFEGDFTASGQTLSGFSKGWLPAESAAKVTPETPVEFTFYDWKLNVAGATIRESPPTGVQKHFLNAWNFLGPTKTILILIGGAIVLLVIAFFAINLFRHN